MPRHSFTSRRAFTLLEMAAVLVLVGLAMGFGLQAMQASTASNCTAKTNAQLVTIREAITRFTARNSRLPLPAGRSYGLSSPQFGREASSATDAAIDRLINGGTGGNILFGALPFQALGLPSSFASDCWGNKFSYIVGENFISTGGYAANVDGPLTIRRGTIASNTNLASNSNFAVISHGDNPLGAVKQNYSGTSHGWCSVGTRTDSENCDITNGILYSSDPTNSAATTTLYDDLLIYTYKQGSNVYCWGTNTGINQSVLGDGSAVTERYYPQAVSGSTQFTKIYTVPVNFGQQSFCALTADGTPYCWGDNTNSQIGGTASPVNTPTPIPGGFKFSSLSITSGHSCGVVAAGGNGNAGEIRCWGLNAVVALGSTTPTANNAKASTPQPLAGAAASLTFASVITGTRGGCGLTTAGAAWCWGSGGGGQLGNSNYSDVTSPVAVSGGHSFSKLVRTQNTVCGLRTDGRILCWGVNDQGQLGRGAIGSGYGYTSAPSVAVGVGTGLTGTARVLNTSIIAYDVTSGGTGYNASPGISVTGGGGTNGRFGLTNESSLSLLNPTTNAIVSLYPILGDPVPWEVSGGLTFTDIAEGETNQGFFCALTADGTAYCWGRNSSGQIGDGTRSSVATGRSYTSAPTITIVGGGGTGATATATMGSGATAGMITGITVTAPGTGYTGLPAAPAVAFNGGDGYYASATAVRGGAIASIAVTAQGSGYATAPTVTITNLNGYGGTGATATAVLGSGGTAGRVVSVTVTAGGSRYVPGNVQVTFSGGGGSGAAATATANNDTVAAININANENHRAAPTAVNSGGVKFSKLRIGVQAVTAISTTNRLYTWGLHSGGALGNNNGTFVTSPQLLDRTMVGTTTNSWDTTGATFTDLPTNGSTTKCGLATNGASFCWSVNAGNGQGTIVYNYPTATCPTTPTAPASACSYKWSAMAQSAATCAIRQ